MHFKRIILLIIVSLLLGIINPAHAQDTPAEIQFALDALSQQVGTTVELDDLDRWVWEGTNFNDTSLGCPQPGQTYAQVLTPGYIFTLTYQGITYDYRVSEDGTIVLLCESGQALPTPTFPPEVETPAAPPVVATPDPSFTCSAALPARLAVGAQARTTPGLASNVRAQPDVTATQVGEIPPGGEFDITGGPACGSGGLMWWQIQQGALSGWIAQGLDGLYYVELVPNPVPAPGDLAALNLANVSRIVEISEIQGNLEGVSAWSPDGTRLAVANSNTTAPGVWLYDLNTLATSMPQLFETNTMISAVAFNNDGQVLITGDFNGVVAFWNLDTGALIYQVQTLNTPVRALNINPDGTLLAVIGDPPTVALWGVPGTLLD